MEDVVWSIINIRKRAVGLFCRRHSIIKSSVISLERISFMFMNHTVFKPLVYIHILHSFDKSNYILLVTNNQEHFVEFSNIFFLHLVTNYFII